MKIKKGWLCELAWIGMFFVISLIVYEMILRGCL